jgi:hypothetical protein
LNIKADKLAEEAYSSRITSSKWSSWWCWGHCLLWCWW